MKLKSSAFAAGGQLPPKHGCDGDDLSPPLSWSGVPDGTKSLALVCSDPDAPAGTWYHWAIFDLAPETTQLPEGYGKPARLAMAREALNDFGRPSYGGPCPPKGHGTHHYHFRLYALDVGKLEVGANAKCKQVEAAARQHEIAQAELIGIYSR